MIISELTKKERQMLSKFILRSYCDILHIKESFSAILILNLIYFGTNLIGNYSPTYFDEIITRFVILSDLILIILFGIMFYLIVYIIKKLYPKKQIFFLKKYKYNFPEIMEPAIKEAFDTFITEKSIFLCKYKYGFENSNFYFLSIKINKDISSARSVILNKKTLTREKKIL